MGVYHAKRLGITIDATEAVPLTVTDATAQLANSRLKATGDNTLWVWTYSTALINVMRGLAQIGWSPRVVGVVGAATPPVPSLLASDAPGVLKNMLAGPLSTVYIRSKPGLGPKTPLAQAFIKYMRQNLGRPLNGGDLISPRYFDIDHRGSIMG